MGGKHRPSAPSQTTRRALAVWLLGGGVTLSIAANAVSIRTTIGDRVTYGVLVLIAISVIVWGLLRNPAPFQRPPWPLAAWLVWMGAESLQAPVRNGVSAMAVVTDAVIALTPGLLFFALAYWRPQRATVTQVLVAVALAATVAEMIGWALARSARFESPPLLAVVLSWTMAGIPSKYARISDRARLVAGVLVVIQAVLIVASRSRTPLVAWGVTGVVILFLQERDLRNRILRVSGAAAGVVLLVGMIFGPSRTGNIAQDFARLTRLEQFATGQQDTSLESRLAEASDVRRTMAIEGGPLTQLVGFGHGASYLPHDSLIKPNVDPKTGRVHNIHITPYLTWFRWGWVGLVLFTALVVGALRRFYRAYRDEPSMLTLGLVLTFGAYILDLFFRNSLADPVFALLIALAYLFRELPMEDVWP